MPYGEQIKRVREARGLSRLDLAYKLQVSELTVGRWERGQMNPTAKNLHGIASALNCWEDLGLHKPSEVDAPAWAQRHHDELLAHIRRLEADLERCETRLERRAL